MSSRSNLEIKSRLFLGLGLLGLVVALLLYLLLKILLPLFAVAFFGIAGFWLWKQYCQKQKQKQQQEARINAQFYKMLKQQQGRISVLDFAMRTQLDGAAAQAYLNEQAQVFSAFFDTTPQGDLIYVFNSASFGGNTAQGQDPWAQANAQHISQDMHWAYAEQAMRHDRNRADKANAAWTTARQVRTLSQLAKSPAPIAPKLSQTKPQPPSQPQFNPHTKPPLKPRLKPQSKHQKKGPSSGGFIHMELTTAGASAELGNATQSGSRQTIDVTAVNG